MPTLGKNVEYAIHSLVYFVGSPVGSIITIRDLSKFQNISESYLAKAFTKLKKYGVVRSNIGVNGGYSLAKSPDQITFLDIVLAVEGEISFFQCNGVRERCLLVDKGCLPWDKGQVCAIHQVMKETENKIKESLKARNLQWLYETIKTESNTNLIERSALWFENNVFNT
jgi:Rrf2 family protein